MTVICLVSVSLQGLLPSDYSWTERSDEYLWSRDAHSQPTVCSFHVTKFIFEYPYTSEFSLVSGLRMFSSSTSLILLEMLTVEFKYLILKFIATLILILN